MPKPKPAKPTKPPQATAAIVTWADGASKADVLNSFSQAIVDIKQPTRSTASDAYRNVAEPNISVRDSFDRNDYEDFRDEERMPKTPKECMRRAMEVYDDIGIVRNVIDLMTDFAVKGIDLEHPSDEAEKFYKEWFRRVDGYERSAAFLKQLFLCNNVIVRRHTAKIPKPVLKKWKRTQGQQTPISPPTAILPKTGPDYPNGPPKEPKDQHNEIPLRYSFMNPLTVDMVDESLATFVGPESFRFHMAVPTGLANKIRNPRGTDNVELINALPPEVVSSIRGGSNNIALDPAKVNVFYYKRDDWQPWATPFIRSIMPDLQMLQKMKLADISALDGAISNIRVWKLGSVAEGIYPPAEVLQYLANILTNSTAAGVIDLVWGPDIELIQTKTDVHNFLGETKYAPVLNAIFQGLGVPATLNGTGARPGTGFTNNYMSLQTFVERLEYARMVLKKFWENELRRVQLAVGHRRPATLTFDGLLTDEASLMQVYLGMVDRDLISVESIQEMVSLKPEIEKIRLRKEMRAREGKKLPAKASPFHDANHESGIWKILAQSNQYTPEELGLEAKVPSSNDAPPAERGAKITKKYAPKPVPAAPGAQGKPGGPKAKLKGEPGEGRPDGSKDGAKRKQKTMKPKTGKPSAAFVQSLARAQAQSADIAAIATPMYLEGIGKKTAREMTHEEAANFEQFRFAALCSYTLDEAPTAENLKAKYEQGQVTIPVNAALLLKETIQTHLQQNGREPTTEVVRGYMAGIHALAQCDCI